MMTAHDYQAARAERIAALSDRFAELLTTPVRKRVGRPVKRVRCIDTGHEYASSAEAEKATGVPKQAIRDAINRGFRAKGLSWEYVAAAASGGGAK